MDIAEEVKKLPLESGVYIMKGEEGQILYVGKAVSLRKRVQSYFRKTKGAFPKTDMLVSDIRRIDYIRTASEAEALLLEASLIKEHHPRYNVEFRDDKTYPYIAISKEKFPRVALVRLNKKELALKDAGLKNAHYYGPYVNPKLVRDALGIIRRIFHFRICHPFPGKVCLDYHMGLCDAPCEKHIDEKEYAKLIRNTRLILEGKKDELHRNLREEMDRFAKEQKFEEAAKIREQIRAIGALYSGTKDINYYKEAEQLQRALNLPRLPERIEAFDISNIMGNQAAGSMVSFFNGKSDKNNYRRFRIREAGFIDDFKMIAEIVRRRYTRLKNERLMFPDLIIIDGGKGQLSAALQELKILEVDIPMISIAKREEEIFLPGRRLPVILPADSLGLKLIQRLRDEAHRFALSYHHKLREKNTFAREKSTGRL